MLNLESVAPRKHTAILKMYWISLFQSVLSVYFKRLSLLLS